MKHSIEYSIEIQGKTKESLIKECNDKLEQLDIKLGKNIGANKERKKLNQKIKDIQNYDSTTNS
jgi:hypothetical protein